MATKQKEKQDAMFSKEQILASNKYANRRDALDAILEDNGVYTIEQVDSLLEKFMKGKVN
ncbi:MAG: hypothetical protein IJA23_00015 [Clostridia bacterium]|nr:hypothetical protein [Clostridia bacterium]